MGSLDKLLGYRKLDEADVKDIKKGRKHLNWMATIEAVIALFLIVHASILVITDNILISLVVAAFGISYVFLMSFIVIKRDMYSIAILLKTKEEK